MRLHRVSLTAFGPFPGTESIDFDALSEAGLFLLKGETGSGKTSLLDAVCYGLYGALPGVRGGTEKRIRSDYAAPGIAPEVTVEFSVGERRLRLTRSPEWNRPKVRGSGTTKAQASAVLAERVGEEWVPLSSRIPEVAQSVRDALGMDVHQFTRVAMLPQGEFAAFLRSDDADREKLLKRLFDTTLFDTTVERARQRKRELAERVGERGAQREAMVFEAAATAREYVGAEALEAATAPAEAEGEPVRQGAARWFERLRHEAKDRVDDAETVQRSRQSETALHRDALQLARRTVDDAQALAAWSERRRALEAGREAAEDDERRLTAHRDALAVRSELDAARLATDQLGAATDAALERLAALRAVPGTTLASEGVEAAEWASFLETAGLEQPQGSAADELRLESVGGWIARAESADEAAAQALKAEETSAQAALHAASLAQAAQSAQAAHAQATEKSTEAAALLDKAARVAADAPAPQQSPEAWDEEISRLSALVVAAQAAQRDREAVVAAEGAEGRALAGLDEAEAAAREVQERRTEALVSVLAAELVDGEACPVCGSPEHPAPNTAAEELPGALDKSTLVRARAAVEAAKAAREQRTAELATARTRHQESVTAARGHTPESASTELAGKQERRAAAKSLQDAHRTAAAALEKAQAVATAAAAQVEAKREEAARAGAAHGEAEAQAAQARERAAAAAAGHEDLRARRAAIGAWRKALAAAREAWMGLAASRRQALAAGRSAGQALAAAGLTEQAARDGVLAAAEAQALTLRVQDVAAERSKLEELAATEALVRARASADAGSCVPDAEALAALAEALTVAERRESEAAALVGAVRGARDTIARQARQVAALDEAMGPLLRRFETASAVADLFAGNGENLLNMSLPTYVLAARLEAVAEAATHRLDSMSDGRFRLVHVDTKSGNKKSGLGLAVEDSWTGTQRSPQTLSGGESFMASLALALGLADVVQEESGGVQVETLFVDEGFGTLDAETLEQVLDGLDQLRRGGRLVGVVSHVSELGARIPAQVQVTKTRHGSTARLVGVGDPAGQGQGAGPGGLEA